MGASASLMTIEGNPELSKEIQDEYYRLVRNAQGDDKDGLENIERSMKEKFEGKVREWKAQRDFDDKSGVEDRSDELMKNFVAFVESRLKVLCGEFVCSSEQLKDWVMMSLDIVVFVSSTFTDTHVERNILLNVLLPELRKLGREQGVNVRFVDMRYGVKDESTLRQMTWEECVKELEKCFRESAGIAFFSLQGDKYGYMPLPRIIRKVDFDYYYKEKFDDETREIADKWYLFDSNTQRYVLKNLEHKDDAEYWDKALPMLRKGLDMLEFDPDLYPGAYVGRSVTEWEFSRVSSDSSRLQRCIWAHRTFTNRDDEFSQEDMGKFTKFFSERNAEARNKLANLHSTMKDYFSKGRNQSTELSISWFDYMNDNAGNAEKDKYLKDWDGVSPLPDSYVAHSCC